MDRNLENISKQIEKEYGGYVTLPIRIKNIDIYTIIQNILPEYRLYIFSKFCNKLNAKDYNMGLKYAYTKTKDINSKEAKIPVDQVLELFKKIDKKLFMEEDYEDWCDLPEVITIYRGTPKTANRKALSWTLDEKRAIWFYKRYNSKGVVYKAKINKKDTFCYLNNTACKEQELIVDYNKIYDIEELSKNKINRIVDFNFDDDDLVNMDYVVEATTNLLQSLASLGIEPNKKLTEEIYKTYEEKGNYKSNYIIDFGNNNKITVSELIQEISK